MNDILVAYFSASGHTKKRAQMINEACPSDIYEIRPEIPYSKADLNWLDKKSRSSIEMNDKSFRPKLAKTDLDIGHYSTIFLGFPIWWYVAPTIINTFLESYDFTGKTIILFATSGSSGFGDTLKELQPSASKAMIIEGKMLNGLFIDQKIKELLEILNKL